MPCVIGKATALLSDLPNVKLPVPMSQAIYRKWRPARFDDVIGQEHVTRTLQQAITSGRIGHAYLFCGPRGTGKTTSARLLAKAVNCLHDDPAERPDDSCHICRAISEGRFLDLIEIDAASNNGVDDIRDLRDKINFAPSEGRFKVYIIDEVHMLSQAAFNALLKTLEEPPPHAIFVLATTEEHKVLTTIKSRCQQFNFRLLSNVEIVGRLQWLATQENLSVEPAAIQLIAREGAGSLRDAESLLDQLITVPGDTITLKRTQQVLGTASFKSTADLVDAWLSADSARGLQVIHEALATGADTRQFCRQMVGYLRNVLLLKTAGDALTLELPNEQKAYMLAQAGRANQRSLLNIVKIFNSAAMAPSNSWQPQLPLELAFIEALPTTSAEVQPTVTTPIREVRPATPIVQQTQSTPAIQPAAQPPVRPQQVPVTQAPALVSKPIATKAAQPATFTIQQVASNWGVLVRQIRQGNKKLPALLSSAKPINIEGNTVILGFRYSLIKEKYDKIRNANNLVAETLSSILRANCRIRAVDTNQYIPPKTVTRAEFEALAQELGGVVVDV